MSQGMLTPKAYQQAKTLLLTSAVASAGVVMTLLIGYVMASPTFGWTGAAARRSVATADFTRLGTLRRQPKRHAARLLHKCSTLTSHSVSTSHLRRGIAQILALAWSWFREVGALKPGSHLQGAA